jgi:PAN domain
MCVRFGHRMSTIHLHIRLFFRFAGPRHSIDEVFWIDSAEKRGDFCDLCLCDAEDASIDCRGRDLVIVPKTFTEDFVPKRLDLRENPRLNLIGVGSLESIEGGLVEIIFPAQLKHIGFGFFESLPFINKVRFEDASKTTNSDSGSGTNFITTSDESFSNICCSLGERVGFDSSSEYVDFCDLEINRPGIDSVYFPFTKYPDDALPPIALLLPSSEFMSEAAESAEKCAEYCSITSGCRHFMYDARYPNAEHECHLLASIPGPAMEQCCDRDDYADLNRTLPGWTTGLPPRTRHDENNATVRVDTADLVVGPQNGFSTEYTLSLGSKPIRGAVWIEPVVRSEGFDVEISPRKVVLYDTTTTVAVQITILNARENLRPVLVIENAIQSCDVAYLEDQDNVIYIEVQQESDSVNLAILIPTVLIVIALLTCIFGVMYSRMKKSQEDSLWKVEKEELHFDTPPEVLGRGTFGLVLLAEYRGTKVAVKRAVPPRNNRSIHFSMMDMSSDELSVNDKARESGSMSFGVDDSGSRGLLSLPKRLSFLQNPTSSSSQKRASSSLNFDQLKSDFVEEMRILSRLRHPW